MSLIDVAIERVDRLTTESALRIARALIYSASAYVMLWLQSVYDGSYLLGALLIFIFALTKQSLVMIQVLLGLLFALVLFSDQIGVLVNAAG